MARIARWLSLPMFLFGVFLGWQALAMAFGQGHFGSPAIQQCADGLGKSAQAVEACAHLRKQVAAVHMRTGEAALTLGVAALAQAGSALVLLVLGLAGRTRPEPGA